MQIDVRRLSIEDAKALSILSKKTFFDTFVGTCTDDDMQQFLQHYFNEQQMEDEIADPSNFYFFAQIDGRPIGYLKFKEDYSDFSEIKKWKALELKRLYVLSNFHGKGVANILMDYILKYAADNLYQVVWLGVWEHNLKAQKFYDKYGFKNSGYSHNFPVGNTPQTDFWFWKFLI